MPKEAVGTGERLADFLKAQRQPLQRQNLPVSTQHIKGHNSQVQPICKVSLSVQFLHCVGQHFGVPILALQAGTEGTRCLRQNSC